MLIPAAIVGVIVFLYGCATVDDNIPRYPAHVYCLFYVFFVSFKKFSCFSNVVLCFVDIPSLKLN